MSVMTTTQQLTLSCSILISPLKQIPSSQHPAELDIWTLIASQPKNEEQSCVPYIHPMLKRSASALTHRSLQVCTESLGSETGSDDFSSLQSEDDRPQQQQQQQQQNFDFDYEDVKVAKYNFAALGRKLPPPLPCLSSQCDRPSVRMKPRREDGRLVLEAVSVSAHNNFKAERQDGRLLLTFANQHQQEEEANETEEYLAQNSNEGNEIEIAMPKTSSGMIELHRLALRSPNILAGIKNPTCPHQFKLEGEEEIVRTPVAESLNAYDYCWRAKPTAAQAMEKNRNSKHVITKNNSSIIADQKQKQSAVTYLTGCKEHRRSLFWEPYCIATS